VAQSLASARESNAFSNSVARADLIRESAGHIAMLEAKAKAINAEIRKYKIEVIRGHLGFKIADFNAVCRISQLDAADRDQLLECVREGFQALGLGGSVDWVDAAERTPTRRANGAAPADDNARRLGRIDGLNGGHAYAARYPLGEPGHGDYELGVSDGQAERERVMALGDDEPRPRRRGRPAGSRNRPKPGQEHPELPPAA